MTVKLVGFSGSLRRGSLNTRLLKSAARHLPDDTKMDIVSIADIPLYNGDLEAEHGVPESVEAIKDAIAAGDGLVIASPEYNNSVPGVLKNAIDWLSRPSSDMGRVWRDRPTVIMGASPGSFGTTLAQVAWLPIMRTLGADYWNGGRMLLPNANNAFDEDGKLKDDATVERLTKFMAGFVDCVKEARDRDG